jgi:hypothetical protein
VQPQVHDLEVEIGSFGRYVEDPPRGFVAESTFSDRADYDADPGSLHDYSFSNAARRPARAFARS